MSGVRFEFRLKQWVGSRVPELLIKFCSFFGANLISSSFCLEKVLFVQQKSNVSGPIFYSDLSPVQDIFLPFHTTAIPRLCDLFSTVWVFLQRILEDFCVWAWTTHPSGDNLTWVELLTVKLLAITIWIVIICWSKCYLLLSISCISVCHFLSF